MRGSDVRKIALVLFIIGWLVTDIMFWLAGLPIWGTLWLVILGVVVVAEVKGMVSGSGKTISSRFGIVLKEKPMIGWAILSMMGVSWFALLLHLGWK